MGGADPSEGCKRLARAVKSLAIAHALPAIRPVAGPLYHGEAVIVELMPEDWAQAYEFLADMMGSLPPDSLDDRLDERHGVLSFVIVPLTEAAADEVAAELEKRAVQGPG